VTAATNAAKATVAGLGLLLAALPALSFGCRKLALQDSSPRLDELVAQPPPEALEEAGTGKPRELSGRCPKGGRQIPLGSLGDTDLQGEIEIGGAIAYDGGYAVGFAGRAHVA
jgi:hypothetical protein